MCSSLRRVGVASRPCNPAGSGTIKEEKRDEQAVSVRVEDRDRAVRVVLLDRPSKRNAIDLPMVEGIHEALGSAPGAAMVIGSTERAAFSAGADLGATAPERAEVSDRLYGLYHVMRTSSVILLAGASGHAVGGGAQLMIACDLRIVAPDVSIRFMGPGHGLAVGAWGLPSLVGRGRAMDLCLSMRSVDAKEALAMGLVDRVEAEPLEAAIAYATHLSSLDREAVTTLKRVVGEPDQMAALRMERRHNSGWDGSVPSQHTKAK